MRANILIWESLREPNDKLHGIGMVNGKTIDPAGIEKGVVDTHYAEEPVFGLESGSQAK
jgi:hypothetical protein